MSKKPAKSKESAKPEPAQVKAVQRLLDARDYPRAIERARALVERFPDHGSTNALLVTVLDEANRPAEALLAAWNWTRHRPRGVNALQAFVDCAMRRACVALAISALERLAELGVETRASRLDLAHLETLLRDADGSPMSRSEAERFETGKLHLEAQDFAGVLRFSSDATSTPARNNLAVALFHLGRIAEARDVFLEAWQRDPGNLFGLGNALAMRLYLGDETGAAELVVPLAQAEPRRIEDAHGQLQGLLLIGADQAAWDAFQRARSADWAADAGDHLVPEWLQLGGGAAARVGAVEEARTLWLHALKHKPALVAAVENVAEWEQSGQTQTCPALFEWHQVLPIGWFQGLREANARELDARFSGLTASNAYLKAIHLGGVRQLRTLVGRLLSYRLRPEAAANPAERSRDGAAAALRDLARRPVGTRQERSGLLHAQRDAGLIAPDELAELWSGDSVTRVRVFSTEVHRDPDPADSMEDLPDDLMALFDTSIDLIRQMRLDAAEECIQAILARVPDHPRTLGNLATIRERQGRRQDCLETLRRAIAIRPDYLLARCNLAALLVLDGEIEDAKDAVDGLIARPRMHIHDHFALQGVMAMLAQAQGETGSADKLIANLEQMTETDHERRMLATAKARIALVKANTHR